MGRVGRGGLVWWFHGYEHGKWQMESTGEVFHLPITITWRADSCLFEIPDRLIAVFHAADRFNSLLCSIWQCTCTITHYTNKAGKRWPEKSFLIFNEGNLFTASIQWSDFLGSWQACHVQFAHIKRTRNWGNFAPSTNILETWREWHNGISVLARNIDRCSSLNRWRRKKKQ